jgi:hypothetical protein
MFFGVPQFTVDEQVLLYLDTWQDGSLRVYQWFMGKFQRELLDIDAGVYRYDQLIVLKMTTMPAVLLESGSIINRDEEVKMASQEHKDKVATAVLAAVTEYCDTRGAAPPQVSQPKPRKRSREPRNHSPSPRRSRALRPASADDLTLVASGTRGWRGLLPRDRGRVRSAAAFRR